MLFLVAQASFQTNGPFVHGVDLLGRVDLRERDVRHGDSEKLAERPPPLLHGELEQLPTAGFVSVTQPTCRNSGSGRAGASKRACIA